MPLALTFLDGVRWYGEPVVGERPQALLAALAAAGGRTVRAETLVERVWGEDLPANPAKALQVLVSRTRNACGPEVIVREGDGYRLGVGDVDVFLFGQRMSRARSTFEDAPEIAERAAAEALSLGEGLVDPGEEEGPLADLRRDAFARLDEARTIRARVASRSGAHAIALPGLEAEVRRHPEDEALLADLLRSEAAVHGPGAALGRFEGYRTDLRDRLGTDPGPELQRVQAELLALDNPVREGLRFETNELLGRDDDIRRLQGLLSTARVVSILGPGGLGKTRLAHVLGREAAVPNVHFVELVGVTAPEDLVGEVGSALGVRDSVSSRRALTPEQRADVRARVAQHLDSSPSLLILDNCEHVVEAVADLVAYLVATTRGVRVLTTTRSPLAIAAERVYALGELGEADAIELFEQRAVAARPDVALERAAVAAVVRRLDGLPLAIELAAAKVRVMAVADIEARLEDRFALLRGGDRSAPDRHRTLLAVIDWSWNLLGDPERRALRWLSVFHDGFTLAAAETVLGPRALDVVQDLADQSLLSVVEVAGGVRYRMLETVREYGRMQLTGAGEEAEAESAHRGWAVAYADMHTAALMGPGQFAAVDAFRAEENNLADVLRQALSAPDPETVVRILAGIGSYWMILGDHSRLFVLAEAVADAVRDWTPAPQSADAARIAIAMTANNALIGNAGYTEELREHLRRLGPGESDPRVAALVTIMQDFDPGDAAAFVARLEDLATSPDRHLAMGALQWTGHARENGGDPAGALRATEEALDLTETSDGPWLRAILHTQSAQLAMQLGDPEAAVVHAHEALPVLERLGAHDDILQLRAMLALSAIASGDLGRAAVEMERLGQGDEPDTVFGGRLVVELGHAEFALASGDTEVGLARYRDAVIRVRDLQFPGIAATGLEPWVLFAEATALTAHAYYATDPAYGEELFARGTDRLDAVLDPEYPYLDYPVCGLALFALGAWGLLRDVLPAADAVRLLVLADRFAYNRSVPTMSWDRISARAEDLAPGLLASTEAEYGDRRGPDLLDETRRFVEKVGS
ncbi:BTAD domain-containing putative transcriptional regulator [Marmoricola sp. RAF53]|uniref:BTAD domain-containing putative transcriptional regulator n=1 Tax=Marmoricola sp. RAF53 TaxID=3233059 RepID=UPI003F9616AA